VSGGEAIGLERLSQSLSRRISYFDDNYATILGRASSSLVCDGL